MISIPNIIQINQIALESFPEYKPGGRTNFFIFLVLIQFNESIREKGSHLDWWDFIYNI